MSASRIILIGGGARSGKTAFALAKARSLGERRLYLATAEALDDEMRARVLRHRADRGDDFKTREEPLEVPALLGALQDVDVVVIDCVTFWISNLLLRGDSEERVLAQAEDLLGALCARRFHALVVTNEVGMGLVPETPLGRAFRDTAGRVHQRLCHAADEVYLGVLGGILRLKPGPVGPGKP